MKSLCRSLTIVTLVVVSLAAPAWSAPKTAAARKPLTVNELAAKPDAHLGRVAVVGRVAAVSPGKGFTLIDSSNCGNCVTECLTSKTTKKVPLLWPGSAPAVKDVVRVEGTLARTAKGFTFTAVNVTRQ